MEKKIVNVAHVRKQLPHYSTSVYNEIIEKLPEAFPNLKYAGTVPEMVREKLKTLSEAEMKHELVQDILQEKVVKEFL